MSTTSRIGVYGLAVMGQNLALNIAEHLKPSGQSVAVCNRSPGKVDETVARAAAEGGLPLLGYKEVRAATLSVRGLVRVYVCARLRLHSRASLPPTAPRWRTLWLRWPSRAQ